MSQREHPEAIKTVILGGIKYAQDPSGLLFPIPEGAAPDTESEGSEDEGGDDKGEDEEDEDEGAAGGGADDDEEEDEDEPITRAEFNKAIDRMKAADRRANKAEKALREIEDKDKDKNEVLERDLNEAKEKVESQDSMILTLRLENAIMAEASGKFHDLRDVVNNIDIDDVTDDDGEVDKKALSKSIQTLGKNKPYLLVESSEKDDDDDDEEEDEGGSPSGTSQRKDKGKGKGIDKAYLAKKYPALRGR